MDHAYVIGANINDGSGCKGPYTISGAEAFVESDNPSRLYLIKLERGALRDEELVALESPGNTLEITTVPKIRRLPEVYFASSIGPYFVSPSLRALIEELEPGVHKFYPFHTTSAMPLEGRTDHGDYCAYFRPPPAMDCVAIDQTDFPRPYNAEKSSLPSDPDRRVAIYRQDVLGKHLWHVKASERAYYLMCSDAFARRYRAQKMRGWDFRRKCDLVDRPLH